MITKEMVENLFESPEMEIPLDVNEGGYISCWKHDVNGMLCVAFPSEKYSGGYRMYDGLSRMENEIPSFVEAIDDEKYADMVKAAKEASYDMGSSLDFFKSPDAMEIRNQFKNAGNCSIEEILGVEIPVHGKMIKKPLEKVLKCIVSKK